MSGESWCVGARPLRRTLSARAPPRWPSCRQPGAWPLFGPILIVVLMVIMKTLGERASLHCNVKLEITS